MISKEDKRYQEIRDKLIPLAEKEANKKVGSRWRGVGSTKLPGKAAWDRAWNQAFLEAMDRLWKHTKLMEWRYRG